MKRTFQVVRDPSNPGHEEFADAKSIACLVASGVIGRDRVVVHQFEASTGFEAMTEYYRWRGSGKYSPELDGDGKPYPEEFEEFAEE